MALIRDLWTARYGADQIIKKCFGPGPARSEINVMILYWFSPVPDFLVLVRSKICVFSRSWSGPVDFRSLIPVFDIRKYTKMELNYNR